jgi:ABC-type transport system involved in multi-copper enzyme maturation permease subunit
VAVIGLGVLISLVTNNHWAEMRPQERLHFDPVNRSLAGINLAGIQLAQLAIGVLGVLVITAEYSTGMIRASLTAVPKRLPVLWAKAIVYGLTTLVLMIPAALIAFLIGQAILAGGSGIPHLGLGDPGVARAVVGAGLYLTVVGLFGLGLGAIVRNTAGGIATFAGIMFVLPPLMNVLPSSWNTAASPYLPLQAGESIMSITGGNHLSPWAGFGVLCCYTAASLAIAAVLLVRRDT